ncbi:MAG TPA: DUF4350 domain-containing protein [Gemmatimonadales bacterium]|nr:DUF4350 domain-containing protein [Gemmatimonadales bacterium]
MRPRTEFALAIGLFAGIVALVAAAGASRRGADQDDPRASSYLPGPYGVRGLADGLRHLEVQVRASRRLLPDLESDSGGTGRRLLLILNPPVALSGAEQEKLLDQLSGPRGADLLLAGRGADPLMRCFGYRTDARPRESVKLQPVPGEEGGGRLAWPTVSAVLSRSTATIVIDSSRMEDAGITSCAVPPMDRIDTLLRSESGRTVALRLWRADLDQRILLVADPALLRNRAVKESPAGPFMLGLLAEYPRVVFDEMHQGFVVGGSLRDAVLEWSGRTPWGWALWQLAAVGLLALAAAAVRFGPIRPGQVRQRRSPLEHVRALATALAASHGHDVAIGSIVRGLHRRLHPASRQTRVAWREWVDRLAQQLRRPRAQQAARTLQSLTRPGQPSEGVLRAANAVEDVWEELRP